MDFTSFPNYKFLHCTNQMLGVKIETHIYFSLLSVSNFNGLKKCCIILMHESNDS
jgi:hypothetical protein